VSVSFCSSACHYPLSVSFCVLSDLRAVTIRCLSPSALRLVSIRCVCLLLRSICSAGCRYPLCLSPSAFYLLCRLSLSAVSVSFCSAGCHYHYPLCLSPSALRPVTITIRCVCLLLLCGLSLSTVSVSFCSAGCLYPLCLSPSASCLTDQPRKLASHRDTQIRALLCLSLVLKWFQFHPVKAHLVGCFSTLKMEMIISSEMSVHIRYTCNIPGDGSTRICRRESLRYKLQALIPSLQYIRRQEREYRDMNTRTLLFPDTCLS
jgi:hypothetical protein